MPALYHSHLFRRWLSRPDDKIFIPTAEAIKFFQRLLLCGGGGHFSNFGSEAEATAWTASLKLSQIANYSVFDA